jgi:hypothetical protein
MKPEVIFLDIDNTLIQPLSVTAQNGLIDSLKKERETVKNFEKILSKWRLQRKIMLTDERWPGFIERLKKDYLVFGLTKMEMGRCGDIENVEAWRCEELKKHNIVFSNLNAPHNFSCEYQGVFYAQNNQTKGEIVELFLKNLPYCRIILVDDLLDNLESVEKVCKRHNVAFKGIHFCSPKKEHRQDVWDYQRKNLIGKYLWTEDDEALKALGV